MEEKQQTKPYIHVAIPLVLCGSVFQLVLSTKWPPLLTEAVKRELKIKSLWN